MDYYPEYRKQYRDIINLLDLGAIETYTREFKRQINLSSSEEKRDFLENVTAMANTLGGELIFGVGEKTGGGYEIVGLPGIDLDKVKQSIESILRDSVEPRLKYHLDSLVENDKDPLLILYIDKTYEGPHRIIDPRHHPFYKRDSSGKHPMDISEIRAAFLSNYSMVTRINEFVDNRYLYMINELDVASSWMALHIVPDGALDDNYNLTNEEFEEMMISPIYSQGFNRRINFDGISNYSGKDGNYFRRNTYVQLFRTGIVESYCANLVQSIRQEELFYIDDLEQELQDHIVRIIQHLEEHHVIGPYSVSLALNGVKFSRVKLPSFCYGDYICDRNLIRLPLLVIDNRETKIQDVLKPHFKLIRSAFGMK